MNAKVSVVLFLISFLLPGSLPVIAQTTPNVAIQQRRSETSPTLSEAEKAVADIRRLHTRLSPIPSHTPYDVRVDLDSGITSMDNGKVRWEFNLADMDPNGIEVKDAGSKGIIHVRCIKDRGCVKWGSHQFLGKGEPLELKPGRSLVQFIMYENTSRNRSVRNREAERALIEALEVLIKYARRTKQKPSG